MSGDLLGFFNGAAVFEVIGDAGSPETVVADILAKASGFCSSLNHGEGVAGDEAAVGELAMGIDAAEEGRALLRGDGGRFQVSVEKFLGLMVELNGCWWHAGRPAFLSR
jgi:hypothetical protein